MPVLGVSSDHGSISPYADNVTGAFIPGAGHFIPDEQPAALARALTDFSGPPEALKAASCGRGKCHEFETDLGAVAAR